MRYHPIIWKHLRKGSAADAEVASVVVPIGATLLDRFELLFDETVDVLVFGAAIVTGTVRMDGFPSLPGFRDRVRTATLVGLQLRPSWRVLLPGLELDTSGDGGWSIQSRATAWVRTSTAVRFSSVTT